MKNIVTILLLSAIAFNSNAQQSSIVSARKDLLEVARYLATPLPGNNLFTSSIPPASKNNRYSHRRHVLTLQVNPAIDISEAKSFAITYYLTISFNRAGLPNEEKRVLKVDYDPQGNYQAKESFVLENLDTVSYRIDSVAYIDHQAGRIPLLLGNTVNPVIAGPLKKDLVLLKLQTQSEHFLRPDQSTQITGQSIREENKGYLTLRWPAVAWAGAYDIEYTYIDNYGDDLSTPISPQNTLYDFRHNNTRIQVNDTLYEIPLVYESGYLLYRVRPVGYWGKDLDKMVTGQWSLADTGSSLPSHPGEYYFTISGDDRQEQDKKNWQAVVRFSENGKRKDAVSYLDGTTRNRQQVSNLSTGNSLLVNEVIYDYFGRPAIEGMPAPVSPADLSTGHALPIAWQHSFTLNTAQPAVPYSWKDFDAGNDCFSVYGAVDTSHGAGNYYSAFNSQIRNAAMTGEAGIKRQTGYVPDAGGYPFIQKEYMPDNTGRLKRLGGPGITHSMSTNSPAHEQRFYYSTPAQQELDAIFGNDAGLARHYTKEIRIDPNGLAAVTYKDNQQRIVATAFTGAVPPAMDSVEKTTGYNDTITVNIGGLNTVDTVAGTISAAYTFTLTTPSEVRVSYQAGSQSFPFTICDPAQPVCYDGIYDLAITIKDECGNLVWNIQDSIGRLTDLQRCNNYTLKPPPFKKQLQPGNYQLSKVLSINAGAIDRIVEGYLANSCWTQVVIPPLPPCDTAACIMDTVKGECRKFENGGVIRPVTAHLPFYKGDTTKDCFIEVPTDFISICTQKMLGDLSPGGQYARFYHSTPEDIAPSIFSYPLSVLNVRNQLPTKGSWRFPVTPYRYENGALVLIDTVINGMAVKRRPEELADWEQFVHNWKPSMAYSLLPYHPEYCTYEWCMANKDFFTYQEDILAIKNYKEASQEHPDLFNGPGFMMIDSKDPLFKRRPFLKQRMIAFMDNIKLLDPRQQGPAVKMATQAVVIAAGFGFPFKKQDLDAYTTSHHLYDDEFLRNDEWNAFKTLYLQARAQLLNEIMRSGGDTCCYKRVAIGYPHCELNNPQCLLYKNKKPVFLLYDGVFNLIDTTGLAQGITPHQPVTCGNCTQTLKLPELLNQLLKTNRLDKTTRLTGSLLSSIATPVTDSLIGKMGKIYWIPDNPGSTPQQFNGSIAGVTTTNDTAFHCAINLTLNTPDTAFAWDKLIGFSCLATGNDANIFSIKAFDQRSKSFLLDGSTTCMDMHSCSSTPIISLSPVTTEYTDIFVSMLEALLKSHRQASAATQIIPLQTLPGRGEPSPLYKPGKDPVYQWKVMQNVPISTAGMNIPIAFTASASAPEGTITIKAKNATSLFSFEEWKITKYELVPLGNQVNNHCKETNTIRVVAESPWRPDRPDTLTVSFDPYPLGSLCKSSRDDSLCCLPILGPVTKEPVPDCDSLRRLQYRLAELVRLEQLKLRKADTLRREYRLHCLRAAESFIASYVQSTWQYTLTYYDQAGNLIKTVPPAGVKPLSRAALASVSRYREKKDIQPVRPAHTMYTTYQYNAANKLITSVTPDAGRSMYAYDETGRLVYSQNAEQSGTAFSARKASFIAYDSLGRVIQSGQVFLPGSYNVLPPLVPYNDFVQQLKANNDTKTDVITTFYDSLPATAEVVGELDTVTTGIHGHNLRNRVAMTVYHNSFQANQQYTHAFLYSYDTQGNVDTLVQDFRGIERYALPLHLHSSVTPLRLKKLAYTYDPVIKKIKTVWYQPGQADQFIHHYEYDAGERLTALRTATRIWEDTSTIDKDVRYQYYLHGPLARKELGQENIQGMDYSYTIQGWLKGVNSVLAGQDKDPGQDGLTNSLTLKDVMAYALNYYKGDYQPIQATATAPTIINTKLNKDFAINQLFNGNIHHIITTIDAFKGKDKVQTTFYKYDALGRLKQMHLYRPQNALLETWADGDSVNDYRTTYRYDANGNFTFLQRNNEQGTIIDDLTYTYEPNTNRLGNVEDKAGRVMPFDLDKENTYTYDFNGRLATESEGPQVSRNLKYTWTNFDKLRKIGRNGTDITYEYNTLMQRIWKYDATAKAATYYVRDLQGNIMATYRLTPGKDTLTEIPLYGLERIGVWKPGLDMGGPSDSSRLFYQRGTREYELANHLGNILTTVSDRRLPANGQWTADIRSAQDYYPLGYPMPGRNLGNYAFGFNGKEKDNEINGNGVMYNFETRNLNTRLGGRFITMDPMAGKTPGESPYAAMGNNPISNIDPDGKFGFSVHWKATSQAISDAGISNWDVGLNLHLRIGVTVYADIITAPGNHHFDSNKDFTAITQTWTRLNADIADRLPRIGFFNRIFGGWDVYQLAVNIHNVQDFYSHSNYVELYIEYYKNANNGAFPSEVPIYDVGVKIEGFRKLMERTSTNEKGEYEGLHTGTYSYKKLILFQKQDDGPNSHEKMNKDEADTPAGKLAIEVAERHSAEILRLLNSSKNTGESEKNKGRENGEGGYIIP